MKKIIVLDTEKLNNDPDSICQISIFKINKFNIDHVLSTFINQGKEPSNFHRKLLNIDMEKIKVAPTMKEIKPSLHEIFKDSIICTYGKSDKNILEPFFNISKYRWCDIQVIAKHTFPNIPKLNLIMLCSYLGIETNTGQAHDAKFDAELAAKVLVMALKNGVKIEKFTTTHTIDLFN